MPVVLVALGHPAFADAEDDGDVLLLHLVDLHCIHQPDTLRGAWFLEEVALRNLKKHVQHVLLAFLLEAFKVCLDLGLCTPRKTFVFLWFARGLSRHEMTVNYSVLLVFCV